MKNFWLSLLNETTARLPGPPLLEGRELFPLVSLLPNHNTALILGGSLAPHPNSSFTDEVLELVNGGSEWVARPDMKLWSRQGDLGAVAYF